MGAVNNNDWVGRNLQGHAYTGASGLFAEDIYDDVGPGACWAISDFNHDNDGIIGGGALCNGFFTPPYAFTRQRPPGSKRWGIEHKEFQRINYKRMVRGHFEYDVPFDEEELFSQLDRYEKRRYEGLRYLMNNYQKLYYLKTPTRKERDDWIARFWKLNDPTPATRKNERRIEHEQRVKDAREQYPKEGFPGWDHRGETYIRFGKPAVIADIPGNIGLDAQSNERRKYQDAGRGLALSQARYGRPLRGCQPQPERCLFHYKVDQDSPNIPTRCSTTHTATASSR